MSVTVKLKLFSANNKPVMEQHLSVYHLLFFLSLVFTDGLCFSESNMFSANMVRQYSFLNQLMTDLESDAAKVCEQSFQALKGPG